MRDIICKMRSLRSPDANSKYLQDPGRHEAILFHDSKLTHSWEELTKFENLKASSMKKSNPKNKIIYARELIISLPQEISNDEEKLKKLVEKTVKDILRDKDYELAVHKETKYGLEDSNGDFDNMNVHLHLMFSERDINHSNVYSKDVWMNPTTRKFCKPNEGVLIHKKGDLKENQSNVDKWTSKDKKYKNKNYISEVKKLMLEAFKEFDFDDYRIITKDSPYVKQKNWNKYSKEDYKNYVISFNKFVKQFNEKQEEFEKMGYSYKDLIKEKNKFLKVMNGAYKKYYKENDNAHTYEIMSDLAELFNKDYKTPNKLVDKIVKHQNNEIKNYHEFYDYNNLTHLFLNQRWSKEGKALMRKVYFYNKNYISDQKSKDILLNGAIRDILHFSNELEPLYNDEAFFEYAKNILSRSLSDMDNFNQKYNKSLKTNENKGFQHQQKEVEEIWFDNSLFYDRELEIIVKRLIDAFSKYDGPVGKKYHSMDEIFGLDEAIEYLYKSKRYLEASKLEEIKKEMDR